ncbi:MULTISPECIES: hypothetical protein [Acinetobacter calcoaceticus/baumannii complex]|nr:MULTISPECIES: hypothetical protein [Acinetobacter calcoaceticus/baumannii complex]MDC4998511.1 hypothetical protein [Acinetobacter baumannii]
MTTWQIIGIIGFSLFCVVMSYYYTWSALRDERQIDEKEDK